MATNPTSKLLEDFSRIEAAQKLKFALKPMDSIKLLDISNPHGALSSQYIHSSC
jgi:hypothetical protein